jgi:hypothetical protein
VSAPAVERPLQDAADHAVRPSLVRAELRRFRSRRFIRVMLLLALGGYVAALVIGFTQFSRTNPDVLANAQQRLDQAVVQQEQFRQDCLAQASRPTGVGAEEFCGPPASAENYGGVENFIDKHPFTLASEGLSGVQGTAFATAAVAFLIGATFIGAEWSGRSLVALLFWEPRRLRVMAAKLGVLAGAAALGVGFVYFAVVESVIRALRPAWQPWLLTDNAIAFVQHTPYLYYVSGGYTDASGAYRMGGHEVVIGHLHAGLVLGAVGLVVVAVGVVLFKRRDLN